MLSFLGNDYHLKKMTFNLEVLRESRIAKTNQIKETNYYCQFLSCAGVFTNEMDKKEHEDSCHDEDDPKKPEDPKKWFPYAKNHQNSHIFQNSSNQRNRSTRRIL